MQGIISPHDVLFGNLVKQVINDIISFIIEQVYMIFLVFCVLEQ